MLADALMDLTDRAEIVLDPFLGAGSTLIAAEKNRAGVLRRRIRSALRRRHHSPLSGVNRDRRYSRRQWREFPAGPARRRHEASDERR
jgi:hypothetical protein